MANISPYLTTIASSIYGNELRAAIPQALTALNTQLDDIETIVSPYVNNLKTVVDIKGSNLLLGYLSSNTIGNSTSYNIIMGGQKINKIEYTNRSLINGSETYFNRINSCSYLLNFGNSNEMHTVSYSMVMGLNNSLLDLNYAFVLGENLNLDISGYVNGSIIMYGKYNDPTVGYGYTSIHPIFIYGRGNPSHRENGIVMYDNGLIDNAYLPLRTDSSPTHLNIFYGFNPNNGRIEFYKNNKIIVRHSPIPDGNVVETFKFGKPIELYNNHSASSTNMTLEVTSECFIDAFIKQPNVNMTNIDIQLTDDLLNLDNSNDYNFTIMFRANATCTIFVKYEPGSYYGCFYMGDRCSVSNNYVTSSASSFHPETNHVYKIHYKLCPIIDTDQRPYYTWYGFVTDLGIVQ